MDRSIDAPQQYKQPSRKGKGAWRKNVDVSEVLAGLDEARDEVIQGGIIAEKSSDSLFTLDTTGSAAIKQSYYKHHKPLKADQILAQRSTVPAVDSHKRSTTTDGVLEPSNKRRKGNGVRPKEYDRLRNIAYGSQSIEDVIKSSDAPTHDPWAADSRDSQQDPRFSFLDKPKSIRAPRTLKEAPISLVVGASTLAAVPAPKPGTSYNPVEQDWEALLRSEGQKAVQVEQKRLWEEQIEREKNGRIAAVQRERDDIQSEISESAWEGFDSEFEVEGVRKRRPERKTPVERNKIKRRKERERAEKWERKMKERWEREVIVRGIGKDVMRKETAREVAKVKAVEVTGEYDDEVDERVLRRRKFGKDALPEPTLELVLRDELQGSLRLLKPEGNLLKDRFRNILVGGKMETRKPIQQPKKKRVKLTEKWTYKDFQAPI